VTAGSYGGLVARAWLPTTSAALQNAPQTAMGARREPFCGLEQGEGSPNRPEAPYWQIWQASGRFLSWLVIPSLSRPRVAEAQALGSLRADREGARRWL
jgi:hypothetical protein